MAPANQVHRSPDAKERLPCRLSSLPTRGRYDHTLSIRPEPRDLDLGNCSREPRSPGRKHIMTREMLRQSYLNADLRLDSPDRATPPNPWQIISSVVTALVAIVSVITQW